jgi:hypothetical protein
VRTSLILALLAATITACGEAAVSDAPNAFPQPIPATAANLLGPWRTTPLVLDPVLVAAVDRACRADIPMPPGVALVVVDARGGGTLQPFYAGPDGSSGNCLDVEVLADGQIEPSGAGGTGSGEVPPPLKMFELRQSGISGQGGDGAGGPVPMTLASGQVGPGITHVVVQLAGQPPILASTSNGWYAAWWPGPLPKGSKVVGYDSAGQPVASADL